LLADVGEQIAGKATAELVCVAILELDLDTDRRPEPVSMCSC
jgi:hypothetical protein